MAGCLDVQEACQRLDRLGSSSLVKAWELTCALCNPELMTGHGAARSDTDSECTRFYGRPFAFSVNPLGLS